jgi:hypothetical protein
MLNEIEIEELRVALAECEQLPSNEPVRTAMRVGREELTDSD